MEDPYSTFGIIALLLVLILLAGVFSLAEAALLAIRPSRVQQLVDEGRRGATSVRSLTDDPPRYIATAQVGVTLFGFAAAAVAAAMIALPLYNRWHRPLGEAYSAVASFATVTIPLALISMVLAGLAPKALAVKAPDLWALRLAPFLRICSLLFLPLSALVLGMARLIVPNAQFQEPMMTREEFTQLVDATGESGEIDNAEEEIIKNVIRFSEKDVRQVMTPRVAVTSLPSDATLSETLEAILRSGHSRIPVYEGSVDNVVGILHAKDLLRLFQSDDRPVDVKAIARTPLFVQETKPIADLLADMRHTHQQLAIVQDEYAGTEGLVTIEDLLEEIVGDIKDESDRDEPEARVLTANVTLLDHDLKLDDVNERLGIELVSEDYTTIGGYLFGHLGHEPKIGEQLHEQGVTFIVEDIEGRFPKTIRAIREEPQPEVAAAE